MSSFHLDHIFKMQIKLIQQAYTQSLEKNKSGLLVSQMKRKVDQLYTDNQRYKNEINTLLEENSHLKNERD